MFEYLKSPEAKREADERTAALLAQMKAECEKQRKHNGGLTDAQKGAPKAKLMGWSTRYNNSNFGMGI